MRTVNGFEPLEDWALKEISDGEFLVLIYFLQAFIASLFCRTRGSCR